jgi:acyl-coenzyme A synthetase/AMP-(fatty) acid ligase/acyl carrier protein
MNNLKDAYQAITRTDIANKLFVQFENKKLSYGKLVEQISRLTSLFKEYGIVTGDRIVVSSSDEEVVVTVTCAAMFNGICTIVVPQDTAKTRANSCINRSKPSLLIIDRNLQILWQPEGISTISITKQESRGNKFLNKIKGKKSSDKNFHGLVTNMPHIEPSLDASGDQPALLNFTSGTTKEPKGVPITYHGLFAHLETIRRVFDYNSESRILNNMDMAHVDGMIQGPLLALYSGSTLYRPCPMSVQHLQPLIDTVYNEKISHFLTVPTMLSLIDRLIDHDDHFEGDHFRHLISVAALLDPNLWEKLQKRFGIRICNMYGLTETVTGGLFCGPGDDFFEVGTVGKPIDISIKIVDSDFQPVPDGTAGELLLQGDNVFSGYFENKEATQATFHEGWFRTGDLASQDENGLVRIRGRCKELIITGGINIMPGEINEVVFQHPAVAEVATVGLPDPTFQEIAVTAVVLKQGAEASEKDIIEYCRDYLELSKIPKKVVFVQELPKGISGKIVMPELIKLIQKPSEQATSPNNNHNGAELIGLAAETFNMDKENLKLGDGPDQIKGWDSMGHLNLVAEAEKHYSITLSAREVMNIKTLNDLLSMIQEKG